MNFKFFLIIPIFVVLIGVGGYFIFGQINQSEDLAPISENTVSFAYGQDELLMKYQGKIYKEAGNRYPLIEEVVIDENKYNWHGLLNAPRHTLSKTWNELHSIRTSPDKESFLFVMRWGEEFNSMVLDKFYLYRYSSKTTKLQLIDVFTSDSEWYNVPVISQFSADGKYVSFNMYGCWNCGGHQPETMLMDLNSRTIKRIGRTSYFAWRQSGGYEYKEYKIIPCPEYEYETMGVCSERPENLLLMVDQF